MKIKEIIEALVKPDYTVDNPIPDEYNLRDLETLRLDRTDAGWYSYGSETNDPHEYNVQTHLPSRLDVDAKYIWIKEITPLMGDNPFVPVYYNIKLKPDKNGISRVSYTMEKLYSVEQLLSMQILLKTSFLKKQMIILKINFFL